LLSEQNKLVEYI